MSRSAYWCITDYVHLDQVWWEEVCDAQEHIQGCAAQHETAPDTGRPHIQAFIVAPQRPRFAQVQSWFPGAHIERMRGTPSQAWDYCLKDASATPAEDGGWRFIYGDRPRDPEPGRRSDLERIRDCVKSGMRWTQIIEEVPGALRYRKEIKMYEEALEEEKVVEPEQVLLRNWQLDLYGMLQGDPVSRRIFWIWSPHSGVGKTTTMRVFMDSFPSTVLIGTRKLADLMYAYKQHRVIWFDMSRSDPLDAEMTTLLEQVSNGGYLFSAKYESVQKRVRAHIVVTSNRPPPEERLPQRCVEYRIDAMGERVVPQPPQPAMQGYDLVNDEWYNVN